MSAKYVRNDMIFIPKDYILGMGWPSAVHIRSGFSHNLCKLRDKQQLTKVQRSVGELGNSCWNFCIQASDDVRLDEGKEWVKGCVFNDRVFGGFEIKIVYDGLD